MGTEPAGSGEEWRRWHTAATRNGDDPNVRAGVAKVLNEVQAVVVLHDQIRDDQVDGNFPKRAEGNPRTTSRMHPVTERYQETLEGGQLVGVILDDEEVDGGWGHDIGSPPRCVTLNFPPVFFGEFLGLRSLEIWPGIRGRKNCSCRFLESA